MNRYLRRRFRQLSFRQTWDQFRVSFWFVPLVMAIFAFLLARIFYWLDARIPNGVLENSRFILSGNPAELRSILIGMATTTLATAGVVFSLLTLPLSTVASQYGSRLLRIYLGDRTTQVVLGMFTGTFCYCLVEALWLPPPDQVYDLPQLSVTFGLVLFLATFGSLIALIQHISTALQAPKIVAAAGAELRSTIQMMATENADNDNQNHPVSLISSKVLDDESRYEIQTSDTGYIQSIDPERMLRLANEADLIIHLVRKPGHFVIAGDQIALAWPADHVDRRMAIKLRHAFQIGNQRTPTQDIEYAVCQLAEVALRAMSAAINDPFTAMTCLDNIGAGLAIYVGQDSPQSNYYDSSGQLRLIYEPANFSELLAAAFDMLRHASCDNVAVLMKMLNVIETIGREIQQDEQLKELLRHVALVQAEIEVGNLISSDRDAIRQRCETLINFLQGSVKELYGNQSD